jgi:hypothetical protein
MSWTVWLAHVAVGTLVLAAFWRAAMTRKGGSAHRQAGRYYLLGMVGILVTVGAIIAEHYRFGDRLGAVRLAYVELIAVTAMWLAWRAIRDRADPGRFAGPVFRALAAAMTVCGLIFAGLGLHAGQVMTVGFGLIGLVFGVAMVRFVRMGPGHRLWWLAWHLNGICLLFAATHDSFVSLGLRSLFPAVENPSVRSLIFVSVLSAAVVARWRLGRRYLRDVAKPARERRTRFA